MNHLFSAAGEHSPKLVRNKRLHCVCLLRIQDNPGCKLKWGFKKCNRADTGSGLAKGFNMSRGPNGRDHRGHFAMRPFFDPGMHGNDAPGCLQDQGEV